MGMVVIQLYILVSKLKKIKTKFLRCTGYLNTITNPINQGLMLILALVRQHNFLNCSPRVLQLLKNMLSSIVKRYMRDPVKTYVGLLNILVKFYINLKLEISRRPVCLLMIFLLFTLLYLII